MNRKYKFANYCYHGNRTAYEMHLIRKMFYFCFQGNHSHNLRLKVYLVVSLVISYVKKDNISILEK
jgi:hypothetical protein